MVSTSILTELRDPRVSDVTVTFVEVSADLKQAKIHASVMGSDDKQQLALRGLRSAAGFLQQKLASRIQTRYTPKLRFVLDQGVKRSIEVSRILDEVLPKEGPREPELPDNAERPDADPAPDREQDADDGPPDNGPPDDGDSDDDDSAGPSPKAV